MPPSGDDQQHEQQERGTPITASMVAEPRSRLPCRSRGFHPVVSRSTGTLALCSTIGDHPGITLNEVPRTVTVAVMIERLADTAVPSMTSAPPALATNADAAKPSLR